MVEVVVEVVEVVLVVVAALAVVAKHRDQRRAPLVAKTAATEKKAKQAFSRHQ